MNKCTGINVPLVAIILPLAFFFSPVLAAAPDSLSCNTLRPDVFNAQDETHNYALVGTAGDVVRLSLASLSGSGTRLDLSTPTGVLMGSVSSDGKSTFTLPVNGSYGVAVISLGPAATVDIGVICGNDVPFDHDKFLQFGESGLADTVASAEKYYQLVDPNNDRTKLDDWKTLNGFIEPLPNTTSGLAAMGISHALYRNATDLGFVRNIYVRTKANGDVVALLENFPSFERTFNRSSNEAADGCSVPFNPSDNPPCTSGGIDAFEHRDLSGMLASVVMEYSAVTPGGPKFTQFYGYGNDGSRVAALDLTGRGKAEAFPGLCGMCHGGTPGRVNWTIGNGKFEAYDPALQGAEDGNFGGGFLPWDPDLYEFHDPLGAGKKIGSGTYSRANQEVFFKELNAFVLLTNPTPATRELIEGWYGGPGLPGSFNSNYVPTGWASPPEVTNFYKKVIAPYCRACHIQRAYPVDTTNPNAQSTQMDFNSYDDLYGLYKQFAKTVLSRTTMPAALVTYRKFWNDPTAVSTFIDFIANYEYYSELIPTELDGNGNTLIRLPGKPIADPGNYVYQVVGVPLQLDGSGSLSADNFSWSVTPTAGVTLANATTSTPTFIAGIAGDYTVTLTVSNNETTNAAGITRPADTSEPASVTIHVANSPFSRVTFESAIKPSPENARCRDCHSRPDTAASENFNFLDEMLKMTQLRRYSFIEGNFTSRLLYKPAALLADVSVEDGVHNGGKILREKDAYFSTLKAWLEDGECSGDDICQRTNVTNENTALEIDPLSPFIDKSFSVALVGITPGHGTLSLTPARKLLYTPTSGFIGLDSISYQVVDPSTGSARLITDKVYVFPDLGIVPPDITKRFSEQDNTYIPPSGSAFEFEKVNSDGDALPNYLDDFPGNPLISRDTDGDGLPDDFNANVSSVEAAASGIVVDDDDDNDGVPDSIDAAPLDPTRSTYSDQDRDGVEDSVDPFPADMTGTHFVDFETGNLASEQDPWVTSGDNTWSVVPSSIIPSVHPIAGNFIARSGPLSDNQSASLSVSLNVAGGYVSFWYYLSSEECCDFLTFSIDGVPQIPVSGSQPELAQTLTMTKVSFVVAAGNHTFDWTYSKDSSISNGLDSALIDAIEFSGNLDSDADGASDANDNCPLNANTDQNDLDGDSIGDACDTSDFDGDSLSDATEVAQGTDPSKSDTDQDGVPDNVDAFPLDPSASVDSDGDGYPDTMVYGVSSTSKPPLSIDPNPFDPNGQIDLDGDGVVDRSIVNVAGTGTSGYSGDGGAATLARIGLAQYLALDSSDNLFIAEGNEVRRVDSATGIITTVAGTGSAGFSGDSGPATAAQLNQPNGIAIDAAGNLFISDTNNNLIRKVDAVTGIITTIAGTGTAGFSGDGGAATAAQLNRPTGIVIDSAGNLFISDGGIRIRRVDANTGVISTYAGNGSNGFSGDGGPATSAQLDTAIGLAIDYAGNLFIADSYNNAVRRVDAATGIITTVAGNGPNSYFFSGDGGLATEASLSEPRDIVINASGDLLIAAYYNNRIRRVDTVTGIITTLAGIGNYQNQGEYNGVPGRPNQMAIDSPDSLTVDSSGDVYISQNAAVRKILINDRYDAFPSEPAASVDTDGDGFPDYFNTGATSEQIAASGLIVDAFPDDPTAAIDTDGDGMPDQFIVGSDTLNPITLSEDLDDDNDGFSDADELAAGSDPLDSASVPDVVPPPAIVPIPVFYLFLLFAGLLVIGALSSRRSR